MTLLRLATLFALLVSVAVCGPAGRIRVSGGSLVDSQNRTRILHGVNVVYKLAPYYPPQGSFDPYYSLTEKDLDILVSLGVTAVRLGVMWPGVEPEAGQYNMTYLGVIREIVDALAARGIYSLLDVHQDVATSFACGEGVPRWASEILMQGLEMPFPFPLPIKFDRDPATGYPNMTQCLEHPFAAYYVTDTVGWVFDGLWKNRGGVLDAFARMWQQVATSFRGVKGVLGYELINEPWPGVLLKDPRIFEPGYADLHILQPVYTKLRAAIRAADPDTPIFFEPVVVNEFPVGFSRLPLGGDPQTVLSWHAYCAKINFTTGDPADPKFCRDEFDGLFLERVADSARLGTGHFVTEFGANDNDKPGVDGMDEIMANCDASLSGWMYWAYKWFGDFTTQSAAQEGLFNADGSLQEDKATSIARPYAHAIAGTPVAVVYNKPLGRFSVQFVTSPEASGPTEIFLSARHFPNGYIVTVEPQHSVACKASGEMLLCENSVKGAQVEVVIHIQRK